MWFSTGAEKIWQDTKGGQVARSRQLMDEALGPRLEHVLRSHSRTQPGSLGAILPGVPAYLGKRTPPGAPIVQWGWACVALASEGWLGVALSGSGGQSQTFSLVCLGQPWWASDFSLFFYFLGS